MDPMLRIDNLVVRIDESMASVSHPKATSAF